MSNPEHVQWLLEGVGAWNNRRRETPFTPDLSGLNVHEVFEKEGRLHSDGNVFLNNINLSGAYLFNINLSYLRLYDADLTSANLMLAKLKGALLGGANLSSADLTAAKIKGANLRKACLVGTKLTSTEPWAALLHDPPDGMSRIPPNLPSQGEITGVGGLLDACRTLREHYSKDIRFPANAMDIRRLEQEGPVIPETLFFFRGEPCSCDSWELYPSVMRPQTESKLRNSESEMLFDLMSRRPEDFIRETSGLEQWVLAQHHGLKTRLLDITNNPLVALFNACENCPGCGPTPSETDDKRGCLHIFAVPRAMVKPFNSDTISVITNFAKLRSFEKALLLGKKGWEHTDTNSTIPHDGNDEYSAAMRRLYHFIRQEKPYFEERIDPRHFFEVFIVEPRQSFDRIRAQSGAFLISAFHERFESEQVRERSPSIPVYDHYTLRVPSPEAKQGILEDLRLLHVTRESLYPGLDEAAKEVMRKYSATTG